MRIRDLKFSVWPPEWSITIRGDGDKSAIKDVRLSTSHAMGLIIIETNHEDIPRLGIILLENPVHLEKVFHKLKENIGRPLTEVGDLEIDL